MRIEYQLNISDYRKAAYFAVAQSHRIGALLFAAVLLLSTLYVAVVLTVGMELNYIVLYAACAEMLWGLLILSKTEWRIRTYIRSGENVLGCNFTVELNGSAIRIQITEKNVNSIYKVSDIYCVYEMSCMFLIYVDQSSAFSVPFRALNEGNYNTWRRHFKEKLGEKFITREEQR